MGFPCFQPQPRQNTRIASTSNMLIINLINHAALDQFFSDKELQSDLGLTENEW